MKAKLKAEKKGLSPASSMASSNQSSKRRSFSRPSWLLCTVADLDEKMKKVALKFPEKNSPDSFAERADAYYQKRPQLLALLQELYNSYVSLADRYCQALAKNHNHRRYSSPIPPLSYNETGYCDEDEYGGEIIDSDAESSLSFQPSFPPSTQDKFDIEMILADLVIRNVDYDFVLDELNQAERQNIESSRKIELQKSLLDVMESERLILLNENATLGYKVAALMEENKALSSESLFMKRKAAELARCILKMREDHRVCMLSRKIEDLQGQIYGLEKRNKEYYEQLVKHEEEKTRRAKSMKVKREVSMKYCFKVPEDVVAGITRSFSFGNLKKGGGDQQGNTNAEVRKKAPKLWDRVKKFDIFFCGPSFNTAYC